jgi:16S rRNA (cytosine967-C5)-methyltransferase
VKPGGILVYATCSVLTEEDEAQVEGFLARVPGFAVLPLATVRAQTGVPLPGDGPYLSLTPASHGTDGFFAAALRREAAA